MRQRVPRLYPPWVVRTVEGTGVENGNEIRCAAFLSYVTAIRRLPGAQPYSQGVDGSHCDSEGSMVGAPARVS